MEQSAIVTKYNLAIEATKQAVSTNKPLMTKLKWRLYRKKLSRAFGVSEANQQKFGRFTESK